MTDKFLFVNNEALTVLNPSNGTDDSPICRRVIVEERLVTPALFANWYIQTKKHEPLKIYADDKESFFQAEFTY